MAIFLFGQPLFNIDLHWPQAPLPLQPDQHLGMAMAKWLAQDFNLQHSFQSVARFMAALHKHGLLYGCHSNMYYVALGLAHGMSMEVLGGCVDDAAQAEKLVDTIAQAPQQTVLLEVARLAAASIHMARRAWLQAMEHLLAVQEQQRTCAHRHTFCAPQKLSHMLLECWLRIGSTQQALQYARQADLMLRSLPVEAASGVDAPKFQLHVAEQLRQFEQYEAARVWLQEALHQAQHDLVHNAVRMMHVALVELLLEKFDFQAALAPARLLADFASQTGMLGDDAVHAHSMLAQALAGLGYARKAYESLQSGLAVHRKLQQVALMTNVDMDLSWQLKIAEHHECMAELAHTMGGLGTVLHHKRAIMELALASDDQQWQAQAQYKVAVARMALQDYEAASPLLQAALCQSTMHGDSSGAALASYRLASVRLQLHLQQQARKPGVCIGRKRGHTGSCSAEMRKTNPYPAIIPWSDSEQDAEALQELACALQGAIARWPEDIADSEHLKACARAHLAYVSHLQGRLQHGCDYARAAARVLDAPTVLSRRGAEQQTPADMCSRGMAHTVLALGQLSLKRNAAALHHAAHALAAFTAALGSRDAQTKDAQAQLVTLVCEAWPARTAVHNAVHKAVAGAGARSSPAHKRQRTGS